LQKICLDNPKWSRLQLAAIHTNDFMLAHGFDGKVNAE
jgi:hypothetical protein